MSWLGKIKCKWFKKHDFRIRRFGAVHRWQCAYCGLFAPKKRKEWVTK
jgi:hypothetical protein